MKIQYFHQKKAGYESGLCDGDNDRRCCSNCDSYCQLEELDSSQYDQKCTNLKGDCKNESNYCKGWGSETKNCKLYLPRKQQFILLKILFILSNLLLWVFM